MTTMMMMMTTMMMEEEDANDEIRNQKQEYEVWNEKGPAPVLVG